MNKFLKILLIPIFLILLMPPSSKAVNWEKVEDSGFNNKRNDYAWSMETFKGKKFQLDCGHHVTFGSNLGQDIMIRNDNKRLITQCSLCSY